MKKLFAASLLLTGLLVSTMSMAGYQSAMIQRCDAVGHCYVVNEPWDTNPPPCWI